MRGITKALLCCSVVAASSAAWGQAAAPATNASQDNEVQQLRAEITRLKSVIGSLEGRLEKIEGAPRASASRQGETVVFRAVPNDATIEDQQNDPLCDTGSGATARILEDPNHFQRVCLGIEGAADFDTVGLSTQLAGNLSSSSIEMSGSYTWRFRPDPAVAGDRFATSYRRLRLGARSKVQDGKPVEFADLSRLGLTPGLVGFGEFEFGVHPKRSRADFQTRVSEGIAAARRACIAYYANRPESEPSTPGAAGSPLRLRSSTDIETLCSPSNLSPWMRDRTGRDERRMFLSGIVGPLWGYDAFPEWFGGIRAEYAEPVFTYFPLYDPLRPQVPLLPNLSGSPVVDKSRNNWSAGLYGGHSPNKSTRLEASVTYQEQHAFPKGFVDVTICSPVAGTTISACSKVNTAAPFKTEGFVLGARGTLQTVQRGLFPSIGADLKLTYSVDTEQAGLDLPIYFAADKDGKLNAGIRLAITSSGQTDSGLRLPADEKAFFFVGTAFQVHAK